MDFEKRVATTRSRLAEIRASHVAARTYFESLRGSWDQYDDALQSVHASRTQSALAAGQVIEASREHPERLPVPFGLGVSLRGEPRLGVRVFDMSPAIRRAVISTMDRLAQEVDGRIDIQVTGWPQFAGSNGGAPPSDFQREVRPLHWGLSVGPGGVRAAGTIGCFATDSTGRYRVPMLVTAGHVLDAATSDVHQPSHKDVLSTLGNWIGNVVRTSPQLTKSHLHHKVDAALVALGHHAGRLMNGFPKFGDPSRGLVPVTTIVDELDVNDDLPVMKVGRSTGLTRGKVTMTGFDVWLDGYHFDDQIEIAGVNPQHDVTAAGDSGAVWVTESEYDHPAAVGLLIGTTFPSMAFPSGTSIASPIGVVLNALDASWL